MCGKSQRSVTILDVDNLSANPTKWSNTLKQFVANLKIYENTSLRQHSFDLARSCNFKSCRGISRVNSNKFDRKHFFFFFAFCHFIVSSSVSGLRNNKLRKLEISLSLFQIFYPINGFILGS